MPESIKFVLATSLVECAGAVLMTVVVLRLHRVYNRTYLRHMALSWAALAVYFFASAIALAAAITGVAASSPTRLAASMISLVAGYWQVAWLVIGTTEVSYGGWITRRKELYVLGVCAAVAIVTPLLYVTDPAASSQRLFLRFGIKSLVTGLAFVAVGIAVHQARRGKFLGRGMVTFAFVAYGLQQLIYFAFTTHQLSSDHYSPIGPYLTFVDFFLLMMIGLGTVVWLLEAERDRVARATRTIDYLANFDPVTGLPNRRAFLERVGLATEQVRAERAGTLLTLDVDGFSAINDTLGRAAGDRLLHALSERITAALDTNDLLARVGDDEIAVFLPDVRSESGAHDAAAQLLDAARSPFDRGGRSLYVTVNAGVALYPDDGETAETLLQSAQAALHAAQQRGRDGFQLYQPSMSSLAADRLAFEISLRGALERGEFAVHYQPIVALPEGELTGFEVLVRWHHAKRGLLLPAEFLGIAEGIGLLPRLEWWVVAEATRQLAAWRKRGAVFLQLSVNLSPHGLQHPETTTRFLEAVAERSIPPEQLQVEITESTAIPHPEATLKALQELRAEGVRIAVDDFGTGFSSLSHLRAFPVDLVKMDRSFVRVLDAQPRDTALAAGIVSLAHALGLPVVAEGVETENQREALIELACDFGQGFLFGTPLDPAACERLLFGDDEVAGTSDAG